MSRQVVLVTGAARRVGRMFAIGCAQAGRDVVVHHGHSDIEAEAVKLEIEALGCQAWVVKCDLADPVAASQLIADVVASIGKPLYALINSAAIFEPIAFMDTTIEEWEEHMGINLRAPYLLTQAFVKQVPSGQHARVINILDWRALRPGADHFPYTITKSALAGMTKSLALALAPNITVNGIALGAILQPADEIQESGIRDDHIIARVPAGRWARGDEVKSTVQFLLCGPAYITGEIIHLDGGWNLNA